MNGRLQVTYDRSHGVLLSESRQRLTSKSVVYTETKLYIVCIDLSSYRVLFVFVIWARPGGGPLAPAAGSKAAP